LEARIIYTKAHQNIGTNGVFPLDLNHDGIIDFLIQERGTSHFSGSGYNGLWAKEAAGNAVEGGNGLAAALKKGSPINSRQTFAKSSSSFGEIMIGFGCNGDGSCSTQGEWSNVKNRYLGLKFQIDGKTHFGWARLSVDVVQKKITATLTGYAYETAPNKGIGAGQTQDLADLQNDPAAALQDTSNRSLSRGMSLARLALGSTRPMDRRYSGDDAR